MLHRRQKLLPDISGRNGLNSCSGFAATATCHTVTARSENGNVQAAQRCNCATICPQTTRSACDPQSLREIQKNKTPVNHVQIRSATSWRTEYAFDSGCSECAHLSNRDICRPHKHTPAVIAESSDIRPQGAKPLSIRETRAIPKARLNTKYSKEARKRHYCSRTDCSVSFSRKSDLQRHLRTVHHEQGDIDFTCFVPGCEMRHARRDKVLLHIRRVHPCARTQELMDASTIYSPVPSKTISKGADEDSRAASWSVEKWVKKSANIQTTTCPNEEDTAVHVANAHAFYPEPAVPHQVQAFVGSNDDLDVSTNDAITTIPKDHDFTLPGSGNHRQETADPVIHRPTPRTTLKASTERAFQHTGDRSLIRAASTPPSLIRTCQRNSIPARGIECDLLHPLHAHNTSSRRPSSAPPSNDDSPPVDGDRAPSSSRSGGPKGKRASGNPPALSGNYKHVSRDNENNEENNQHPDDRSQGKRRKVDTPSNQLFLVCIGHHRNDHTLDRFPQCKTTRREYISQLEKHHELHGWFYCTRCLETFENITDCRAHKTMHNCRFKCVTETCDSGNYGTYPLTKCSHAPPNLSTDSGDAVWKELFRIFRPGETVPNPRVPGDLPDCSSPRSVATPRRNIRSPPMTPLRGETPFSDDGRSRLSLPSTNVIPSIEPFSPTSDRVRAVLTLAKLLWRQVRARAFGPSELIRRLYEQAMDPAQRYLQGVQADQSLLVLEQFVEQLWGVATGQTPLTEDLDNELQIVADLWIRPTDNAALQPPASHQTPSFTLSQEDPTPLDGVGYQFGVQGGPVVDGTVAPVIQVDDQPLRNLNVHAAPWVVQQALTAPAHAMNESWSHEPQVEFDIYTNYFAHNQSVEPLNIPQSQGVVGSGSRSSFPLMSPPTTYPRDASFSTNLTSGMSLIPLHNDSQNMQKPTQPESLPEDSLPGSSTGVFSPMSRMSNSQVNSEYSPGWNYFVGNYTGG